MSNVGAQAGWTTWDDELDGYDPAGSVTSIVNGVTVVTNAGDHIQVCEQVRRAQEDDGAYTGDAAWDDIGDDDAWEEYLTVKYGADIHSLTDAEYEAVELAELSATARRVDEEQGNILDAILCEEDA